MATLRDVARQAGVDPSTVSRVINADGRLTIREETRSRILAAVHDLGYRPHAAARGLRLRAMRVIGCVARDLTRPDNALVVAGALDAAQQAGYGLLLLSGQPGAGRVDGVVSLGSPVGAACPEVVVGAFGAGYFVTSDDETGATLAVQALIDRGHRRVGCLLTDMRADAAFARFQGYRRALAAARLPFDLRLLGDDPQRLAAVGATALFVADGPTPATQLETVVWGREVRTAWRALGGEAVRLVCDLLAGRAPARRGRLVAPEVARAKPAGMGLVPPKLRRIQG